MKRSLYREYRPQTFAELVGQEHVARTLRNAFGTGGVAHAYVFAGPRGTGKTSTARILAKSLNCVGTEQQPVTEPTATPCGVCRHCVAIAGGVSLDVVELDAASNRSIDDVRDLRDKIAFAPVDGRSKVYIVDEVHMLTREAFNALLKTLEEPPPGVVFVLATTEPHKIPETIISRCQRFDFRRPHAADIVRLLASIVERENARPEDERGGPRIEIQEAALQEIARHSRGGFRDAIGTLEKLVTYADGTIRPADVLEALGVTGADLLFEITDIVTERRTAEALQFVQRLANEGADYLQFIRDLLRHLRQLFLLQHLEEAARDEAALRTLGQSVELDTQVLERLLSQANTMRPGEVVHFIETLGSAQREIRDGLDARLQLELALVKVTRPHLDHSAAGLEERLRRLEAAAGGLPAAGPGGASAAPAAAATPPAAGQRTKPAEAPPQPVAPRAPAATDRPAPMDEPAPGDPGSAAGPPAPGKASSAAGAPQPGGAGVPEEPATPAASAEPVADPELTLDRVRRGWELVLQRLQATDVGLYAVLRDARPSGVADGRLTVTILSEVALNKAAAAGNDSKLADALEKALGLALAPEFVLPAAADEGAAASPAPAQEETLDFTDLIRQTKDKFDADELPDDS